MTPEVLTAVASIGTFVVIAATAIAAIVQLHHLRGSNQIVAFNEFREEFESLAAYGREATRTLADHLKDPAARRELDESPLPDWVQPAMRPARLFETLGTYVKHGIVSREIVCDLWAPAILTSWNGLAPVIVVMRRTRGRALFENFEMLACLCEQWMQTHDSDYPKNLPRITPPDPWAAEDKVPTAKPDAS